VLTGGIADRRVDPPEVALSLYPLGDAAGAGVDVLVRRIAFEQVGGFEECFHGLFEPSSPRSFSATPSTSRREPGFATASTTPLTVRKRTRTRSTIGACEAFSLTGCRHTLGGTVSLTLVLTPLCGVAVARFGDGSCYSGSAWTARPVACAA
jgi:hypothetical protein